MNIPIQDGRMPLSETYSTVLYNICYKCKTYMGTKNGYGIFGISHCLCEGCYEIEKQTMNDNFFRKEET